jgi:hypothetical protein
MSWNINDIVYIKCEGDELFQGIISMNLHQFPSMKGNLLVDELVIRQKEYNGWIDKKSESYSIKKINSYLFTRIQQWCLDNGCLLVHGALAKSKDKIFGKIGPGGSGKTNWLLEKHRGGAEMLCDDVFLLSSELIIPFNRYISISYKELSQAYHAGLISKKVCLSRKLLNAISLGWINKVIPNIRLFIRSDKSSYKPEQLRSNVEYVGSISETIFNEWKLELSLRQRALADRLIGEYLYDSDYRT